MNRSFLILVFFCSLASSVLGQVRLQDLVVGHPVTKKARFDVADVTVDNVSVRDLFLSLRNPTSFGARVFGGRDQVILKLKDKAAFLTLRSLLLTQQQPRLRLQLVDPGVMPDLAKLLHSVKTLEKSNHVDVPLEVEITPCERITRIVYRSIDSILSRELERAGQTHRAVTLDEVFDLLLKEQIDPFIKGLEPSQQSDSCFSTFTLLKWLRNQEVHGFEFSRYRLNDQLQSVLLVVATSSRNVQKWRHYSLEIDVTGYTDPHGFDKHLLALGKHLEAEAASTGVLTARDPLQLFYAGCSNDRLIGQIPHFVDFDVPTGIPVGKTIDDNCELGAVRAWVTAAYLRERLGTYGVKYRYGSGGIAGGTQELSKEALQRKVDVRITVKAASEQ
jgi:hypothetical protein